MDPQPNIALKTLKIATVNLCAATAAPKLQALFDFIQTAKADIVFLQEVAIPVFNLRNFQEVVNIGEGRRGTAILVRDGLPMTSPLLLPSGRATSVRVGNLCCVNLYAPSGSQRRAERAAFYSRDVTPMFAAAGQQLLVGGDLNCILRNEDSTGTTPKCPELGELVTGLQLQDVWPAARSDNGHTFFVGGMSARLDRFYVSPATARDLLHAETTAVSFSDHLAVTCTLRSDLEDPPRSPSKEPRTTWTLDAASCRTRTSPPCSRRGGGSGGREERSSLTPLHGGSTSSSRRFEA